MKLNENLKIASRTLRKNQTPWEHKLWYHLRRKQFLGYRFRRQFVIDHYIADFCCYEKRLIIELDGGQHNEKANLANDIERAKILGALGFRVLRFWNTDLDHNLEGVLETIRLSLTTPLSPSATSPLKGEKKNTLPFQGRVARSAGRGV